MAVDRDIYFVSNHGTRPASFTARFRTAHPSAEVWDPITCVRRVVSVRWEGVREVALELPAHGSVFVVAFPFAEFTNDVMHACGYLSACRQALGIASPAKEYATCRGIMFRHGAGSAVDRIRRLYPKELEASKEAGAALDDLDRRRGNMRYGWLRRNGYCISSSHVEAAARILVARRCKQAGMHWRHHNAACVCAIIARLRSVA